jgi:hypothetical protein
MSHIQAMELRGTLDVGDPVHMAGLRAIWMSAIEADIQAWAKAWNVHSMSSKKAQRADPRFVSGVPAKLLRGKPSVAHRCVPTVVCAPSPLDSKLPHSNPPCPTPLRLPAPPGVLCLRAASTRLFSSSGSVCSCSRPGTWSARPRRESIL